MTFILGIAGPSCSGKTTVARKVASRLSAPLLHLDQHWVHGAERPLVNGYESFERPHQYDGERLMEAAIQRDEPVVVVEGFLLFAYPSALDCQFKVCIDVPHEELVRRRLYRSANPDGDGVWGIDERREKADRGWHAHGREEWERFGAPMLDLPGVIRLDGTLPTDTQVNLLLAMFGRRRMPAEATSLAAVGHG